METKMEKLSFLWDDDLVEQERDEVRRILEESNRDKSVLEFVFETNASQSAEQACATQPLYHPSEDGRLISTADAVASSAHIPSQIQSLPALSSPSGFVVMTNGPIPIAQYVIPFTGYDQAYAYLRHQHQQQQLSAAASGGAMFHHGQPAMLPDQYHILQAGAEMRGVHVLERQDFHPNGTHPQSEVHSVAPSTTEREPATPSAVPSIVQQETNVGLKPAAVSNTGEPISLASADKDAEPPAVRADMGQICEEAAPMQEPLPTNGDSKSANVCTAATDVSVSAPPAVKEQSVPTDEQGNEPLAKPTFASLFKNEPAAKMAIIKPMVTNRREDSMTDDEALKRAIDQSAKEYADLSAIAQVDVKPSCDPAAKDLASALKKYALVQNGPSFMLRGIVNRGNWCYVNATLQALIACPTFFHLLRNIPANMPERSPSSTPFLDSLTKFASEFVLVKDRHKYPGWPKPLDPVYIYQIVSQLKADASFKGRQEDAEEFLLLALNRLQEEMVAVLSLLDDQHDSRQTCSDIDGRPGRAENDEWRQVGPGGKAAVTRQVEHAPSPIRDIYSGQLRYGLNSGGKESYNLEPFFTLPLDVQMKGVTNLMAALNALTTRETLSHFQGTDKTEVNATRRVTLHELPRVLIFQLKYFIYAEDGLEKITKEISYPETLRIPADMLSVRGGKSTKEPLYKLFAVVFHHGAKAEGGHYTTDVFHGLQWFSMDDTKMHRVDLFHALKFVAPRVPYLLFYRRMDKSFE